MPLNLAFMTAHGFISMVDLQTKSVQLAREGTRVTYELLTISTVTTHEDATEIDKPCVWLNVVVNKNMKDLTGFHDLRGVRWARNLNDKLTEMKTLEQLWNLGESPSFFVNVHKTRSHLESLRFILQRKAQATVVDSNALNMFLREHPDEKEQLHVIESWGPLPPYAIVVRASLDSKMKENIFNVLHNMHKDIDGSRILNSFRINKFARIDEEDLYTATELIDSTKGRSFDTAYY